MSRRDDLNPPKKRLINALFKIENWEYGKCFAPPGHCPRPAIRAHSVQNARSLDLFARKGHVTGITRRIDAERGPVIEFGDVGRNLATTFAGLCAEHDQEIFAHIDRQPFDPGNPQHLFLIAYRAAFRELHVTCAAGSKLQTGYRERVKAGLDPKDSPSPAGIKALDQMILAHETYMYKTAFDEAYLGGDFARVVHNVIDISTPQPTVAACALFSVHGVERNGDWVRACLNILPLSTTRSVAVFSYLPADAPLAREMLGRILFSQGEYQKYELSRRLLNSCENFVLAPAYFDSWTARKKDVVREYFVGTILQEDVTNEDPDLFLF